MNTPAPHFGELSDGRLVSSYRLQGAGGLVVEFLNYGGIVTRILAPDRAGQQADVVLGFDRLEPYLARHPYFGAITGRVAGRIAEARFTFEGTTVHLAANEGRHHLHGGVTGFDRRLWQVTPLPASGATVGYRLDYHSPDGEEGYPGAIAVSILYEVTPQNAFRITTRARSERAVPFSPTHHSYFQLRGEGYPSIAEQWLEVEADTYLPFRDPDFMHVAEPRPVAGNDFRQARRLADALPQLYLAHGDLYLLGEGRGVRRVATLSDEVSGRKLEVLTDEPCLQVYTGANLDGTCRGKSGRLYPKHAGICFEPQGCTPSLQYPALGSILLRLGETQARTTIYRFSTEYPTSSAD